MLKELKATFEDVKRSWRNPVLWKRQIPLAIFRGLHRTLRRNRGIYIMDEDWDNLIILDACRYDYFVDVTGINADHRISRGSATPEFLAENFSTDRLNPFHMDFAKVKPSSLRKFNDTIVVTANPRVDYHVRGSFYRVIPVWKDGWNNELNTVLPKTVVEHAIRAQKLYPKKKINYLVYAASHSFYRGTRTLY